MFPTADSTSVRRGVAVSDCLADYISDPGRWAFISYTFELSSDFIELRRLALEEMEEVAVRGWVGLKIEGFLGF